jgi:hypothetical protein
MSSSCTASYQSSWQEARTVRAHLPWVTAKAGVVGVLYTVAVMRLVLGELS